MVREYTQQGNKRAIGENAYPIREIQDSLGSLGILDYGVRRITTFSQREGIIVTPEELKLHGRNRMRPASWIRASDLPRIIEGLKIPVSVRQLEDALESQK